MKVLFADGSYGSAENDVLLAEHQVALVHIAIVGGYRTRSGYTWTISRWKSMLLGHAPRPDLSCGAERSGTSVKDGPKSGV